MIEEPPPDAKDRHCLEVSMVAEDGTETLVTRQWLPTGKELYTDHLDGKCDMWCWFCETTAWHWHDNMVKGHERGECVQGCMRCCDTQNSLL